MQVNELGNPKNKKPAKVPQFYEITEIIFGLISAGQEIPLPLWAKLIKFGLVNIKSNDMQRREGESKSKDDRVKGSGQFKFSNFHGAFKKKLWLYSFCFYA